MSRKGGDPKIAFGVVPWASLRTMKRAPIKKPEDRYHHGDLRRALVAAALSLLEKSRGDLSEFTLRAVATRAGVSPGAPYHHFEDKIALLAAIAEDGFLELGSAMASSVDNATDTKVVERVVRAYLGWAKMHPSQYRVMFIPELKEARFESIRAVAAGALAQWAEYLRVVKRGRTPQEAQALAVTLWSAMHGFLQIALEGLWDKPGLPGMHVLEEQLIEHLCALAGER